MRWSRHCITSAPQGISYSDRGSHYLSVRYSEQLAEAGIELSFGSRGDRDNNALAETINGLDKTEAIHRGDGPWKTRESVEMGNPATGTLVQPSPTAGNNRVGRQAEGEANYWRLLAEK